MPNPSVLPHLTESDPSATCGRGHSLLDPSNQLLSELVGGIPNVRCKACKRISDRISYDRRKARYKLVKRGCRVIGEDEITSVTAPIVAAAREKLVNMGTADYLALLEAKRR